MKLEAGLPEHCGNWKIACFHVKATVATCVPVAWVSQARLKQQHHTRMTPFLLGGGPHFALMFFFVCLKNPDTQCIFYVQYVYYAHLPLNKPTIHVGIIDHTHRVPGKLILPKTFRLLKTRY